MRRARAAWVTATADRAERRERRDSDFLATTDREGRVVDFRNTLVVMTSNLCQDERFEVADDASAEAREQRQRAVMEELSGFFRPELLNRLDGVVRFAEDKRLIAELQGLERRTSRSGKDAVDHGIDQAGIVQHLQHKCPRPDHS